jgi:hypothetical protein
MSIAFEDVDDPLGDSNKILILIGSDIRFSPHLSLPLLFDCELPKRLQEVLRSWNPQNATRKNRHEVHRFPASVFFAAASEMSLEQIE